MGSFRLGARPRLSRVIRALLEEDDTSTFGMSRYLG